MSVKLAYNRYEQFANTSGVPYAGAKLFTYVGGSVNTKQTTFTESTGTTPNTNPIVLDSAGQLPQPVWLTTGLTYKFVLAPSTDTDPPVSPIWTLDGITGINDSSASQSEWIAGPTPTFVSATSFTLVGDQTTTFAVGRRGKFTVTVGTVYGRITASAFGATTTVTMQMDGTQVLDSGLSAVSYGILASTNISEPVRVATTSGGDTYTATVGIANYILGDEYRLKINQPNQTTTPTINLDSRGAKTVVRPDGSAVVAGDLGGEQTFRYNGTNLVVLTPWILNLLQIAKSGRLTLTTATPVTTSDVTGATTVFFSPYNGSFTEVSQTTTDATKSPAAVTTNSNYDLFLWYDAGTLRCTRGPLWTSDTARGTGAGTTEIQFTAGAWVNKNAITNGPAALTGILVGTIRSDGSSQINDSLAKRHLWNNYNRLTRPMSVVDTTDSWTYSTTTYRQANGATTNQLDYVCGLLEDGVSATVTSTFTTSTATVRNAEAAVGVDSTTVASGIRTQNAANNTLQIGIVSTYKGFPGLGRHFLAWLEIGGGADTQTWFGDNGGTTIQSGIQGEMRG